jgi:hypothetical protein
LENVEALRTHYIIVIIIINIGLRPLGLFFLQEIIIITITMIIIIIVIIIIISWVTTYKTNVGCCTWQDRQVNRTLTSGARNLNQH